MQLLGKNLYAYQTLDNSRHRVTKLLNDEKTHSSINSSLKKKDHVSDPLYRSENAKAKVEHKVPVTVKIVKLQIEKSRMLKFFSKLFGKVFRSTNCSSWKWS